MNWDKIYRGDFKGAAAFLTLKKAMLELLKGYPTFQYFGIFESYFGGIPGNQVVKILEDDELIEVIREKDKPPLYRVTKNGIDLAISMINLDYSEQTRRFTIGIIALTILSFLLGLNQLLLTYLQYSAAN